ncbi:AAA-domain-containing protein [Ramicandelaber brevisporus]|nr:AAA-domain-containing protein [Ramicandelaber brevisporus]
MNGEYEKKSVLIQLDDLKNAATLLANRDYSGGAFTWLHPHSAVGPLLATVIPNEKIRPNNNTNNEDENKSESADEVQKQSAALKTKLADGRFSRHERRLLPCVVDPSSIPFTFADVCLPSQTLLALQTLIILPLLRPEYFDTGLLKRHSVTGLMLFGPPGTGKTHVLKAIARESGATVLAIKGSDINDMYVGEGEKNVHAVFSLARKLAPCVVFIDEVDALFAARRSSDPGSGSRRDILNQFMQEWDGLKTSSNKGIIVVGATNRPFDLDDAVLRRLPRRILVDLPNQDARRMILKIHLKDEKLADDVTIDELAKRTESFSGSDLRNVCVAAALSASIEQSNEQSSDLQPKSEPQRPLRVIAKRHFEEALKQVSPSIAEDRSSLTELRKWDAQFGDGAAARRKKKNSFGFGSNDTFTSTTTLTSPSV